MDGGGGGNEAEVEKEEGKEVEKEVEKEEEKEVEAGGRMKGHEFIFTAFPQFNTILNPSTSTSCNSTYTHTPTYIRIHKNIHTHT